MNYHRYRETEVDPLIKVGDSWLEGVSTKFGKIGLDKGYVPEPPGSQELPVPSGYTRVKLMEIEERFTPKQGTGIHSWLSNKDYSDNPNFEKLYTYWTEEEPLFHDLADLIDPVPTLMKVTIIFDEKNCRQFFLE